MSAVALLSIPFERKGKLFRLMALWWSQFILWIFGIEISTKFIEDLDLSKSYVFVANHASMFDIPAVIVALRGKINLVFKKELARIPLWGWTLKFGHFIMIDRSNPVNAMKSLERAANSIREGNSIILFPEGTRTRDGKLQPFKRGAFSLAISSKVPVVPVTINGTYKILPRGSIKINPSKISVIVERPINTEKFSGKEGELELMRKAYAVIEKYYVDQ